MNQDQKWIQGLAAGEEAILGHIYEKFRSPMILWLVHSCRCDEEVAKEVYQLTILVLYENVRLGKLTELKSSLKTYLFAIGKNKLSEHRKRQSRIIDDYFFEHLEQDDSGVAAKVQWEEKMELIERAMEQLEAKCRLILNLFYFNRCSMKSIAEQLELASENAAKTAKNRCFKKLRNFFN